MGNLIFNRVLKRTKVDAGESHTFKSLKHIASYGSFAIVVASLTLGLWTNFSALIPEVSY